jgi:hypothetical protein
MRRRAIACTVAAGVLVLAAPALATFHLEKVNEVMLASATGDATVQFVELLDGGGTEEQFTPVFAPYELVVYDAAGKQLGSQTLDPSGLRAAAGADKPYLVSTAGADAAFAVTGDEKLTVTLPADAAQVCFRGTPGNVSCMSYGQISEPVTLSSQGTGAAHGPVPPSGQSDQRQTDDTVEAATPTPKAANHRGAAPPTGGPTTTPATFAGARVAARHATVDRRGRAHVAVSCPAGTTGACGGAIVLSVAGRRISRATFRVSAGARRTIAMGLPAAARRALARHRHLTARVTISSHDGAGHRRTRTSTLRLTRG